jgi:dCTP deaminase
MHIMSGVLPDWISHGISKSSRSRQRVTAGRHLIRRTSYGYDVAYQRFKVFTNAHCSIVDPKHFDQKSFVDIDADYCLIPPNSFALAETVEYLEIPATSFASASNANQRSLRIIVNVTA